MWCRGLGPWSVLLRCALCGMVLLGGLAVADDDMPGVEFTPPPPVNFYGPAPTLAPRPELPDIGLLIEGDPATNTRLGQVIMGEDAIDRILYEDDHHRVVGNPASRFVRMEYRYDPATTDWMYDGRLVRGHIRRGSKFGWSVAMNKPYLGIMDWSVRPTVAAIVIYEKTPGHIRGWKKRFEVQAADIEQANCMGGLDANKWLARWQEGRSEECGVRELDGTEATEKSVRR